MERGAAVRATGATKLNEISSRSHAIFMLIVEKSTPVAAEGGAGGSVGASGELPSGAAWQGVVLSLAGAVLRREVSLGFLFGGPAADAPSAAAATTPCRPRRACLCARQRGGAAERARWQAQPS